MELCVKSLFLSSHPPVAWAYEQQQLGFNYRLTDIQAALGLSQLQRLDQIVLERNRQFDYYSELFRDSQFNFFWCQRCC